MGRTIHPPSEYRFRMILRFRTPWAALLCATPDPPRARIPNTTSARTISSTNHSENLNRSRRGLRPISRRNWTDLGKPRAKKPQSVRPARTSPTQARATTKSLSLVPAGTTTGRASNRG